MRRNNTTPTQRQICPTCRGQGKVMKNSVFDWGLKPCPTCNGTGYIEYRQPPWSR